MHTLTHALLKLVGLAPKENHVWDVRVGVNYELEGGFIIDSDQSRTIGTIAIVGDRQTALAYARRKYPQYRDDLFIRPYKGIHDDKSTR